MSETFSKIVSSNKTRLSRLAAIWLFLILLPPLVLLVAFDLILQESESFLTDKLKIRMMQELSDFRGKLSFCSMIEDKMQNFAKSADSAEQLQSGISADTNTTACAVFMIDAASQKLSYHLSKEVKPALGMISKTMMRNFLLYLRHRSADSGAQLDKATIIRSQGYVNGLFATAGELLPKTGQAVPALSGKPELGRLIVWTMPIASDGSALVIFKETDIDLQQLAKFAADNSLFSDLKRSFTYSGEGRNTVYRHGQEMTKFETSAEGGLILKGMASEEMLLRLATNSDYFPTHLDRLYEKLPILKVSASPTSLQHPLRKILAQARLASLALILISSIFILRIALFGYGRGLNIRNRLLLCVLGASILPFSTFMAGIVYHQHFSDDFENAEISQHLYLQQEFAIKSINARVEMEERQLAELSETLGKLNHEEAIEYLTSWQKNSNSALVLYRQDEHETMFTSKSGIKLSQTESDMKTMVFMSLKGALARANGNSQASTSTLGAVGLKAKGLSIILENVGRLYDAISDNITGIFTSFPIYAEDQRFSSPKAYILAKYNTVDLLKDHLKQQPEALKTEEKGKYLVKSCFLPVVDPSKLPGEEDAICSPEFSLASLIPLVRKTLRTRSTSSWSNEKITAQACYYNRLHCIIIHTAQLKASDQLNNSQTLLPGLVYFLLMVFTLVIFMAKMLIVPMDLLKDAACMVADGNYQHQIEFASGDEFEPLTNSFNLMTAGLHQRDLLTSYVSQDVLEEVSSGITLVPGGERVEASVVFCGLEGFKKFSQTADPEQIVSTLARLLEVSEQAAAKHGGVMDKLIEDTIMLVFRRRDHENSHAVLACRAALEICQALPDASVPFRVVSGISSGSAVSGKIGSRTGKLDFTLIGNPVNLAARLKAQAHKAGSTGIIVCPGTIRLLKGLTRQRFIERTEIKGRTRTFPLYELIELR